MAASIDFYCACVLMVRWSEMDVAEKRFEQADQIRSELDEKCGPSDCTLAIQGLQV